MTNTNMTHDYENVVGFLEELASLMDKWEIDAIVAKDEYPGYAECGEDICIRIEDPYCFSFDPDFGGYMHADAIYLKTIDILPSGAIITETIWSRD